MRRVLTLIIALAMGSATATATAANLPDPAALGPFGVATYLYDDGPAVVGDAGAADLPGTSTAFPQEIKGRLSVPVGAGPFPVIILLHGNHGTCKVSDGEFVIPVPPCPSAPPALDGVDSYRGYDELADTLASAGYVVASIDANGSNGYGTLSDGGGALVRAQTIALHLDRFAAWNTADGPAPIGGALRGKVDVSRIGLMGHSRGGEGVARFVRYARDERPAVGIAAGPRYPGVKAVLGLGPTDFRLQAPTGVAYAALLPRCDKDVEDLAGAGVYERTKDVDAANARVQFAVAGANHNWFNTIWDTDESEVNGVARTDSACVVDGAASLRMTRAEQRRAGTALIAAFLRRYVGPEPALDPYVTGAAGLPSSACPARGDCDERVQTSYHAPESQRSKLLGPDDDALTVAGSNGKATATGFARKTTCTPDADGAGCPAAPNRSLTRQLSLGWSGPATLRIPLSGAATDASRFATFSFRAAADFTDARNSAGRSADVAVRLTDRDGNRRDVAAAPYDHGALEPIAGSDERELLLGGVRIPLREFADDVDLAHLASVELRFAGTGAIQLADVAFQEPA